MLVACAYHKDHGAQECENENASPTPKNAVVDVMGFESCKARRLFLCASEFPPGIPHNTDTTTKQKQESEVMSEVEV